MSNLTNQEIIKILGGCAAVSRMAKVRPPSVQGWLTHGIPEGRLIELAAEIERRAPDRFSRRERWPDRCGMIWPDLAANDAPHPEPTTEQEVASA